MLLDGAQGVGAVPTDVRALRCAAYAGAGQKWLCGPDGTGLLYVAPSCASDSPSRAAATPTSPTPARDSTPVCTLTRGASTRSRSTAETVACALGAFGCSSAAAGRALHERARLLAAELAERLAAHGREVVGRQTAHGRGVVGRRPGGVPARFGSGELSRRPPAHS